MQIRYEREQPDERAELSQLVGKQQRRSHRDR